MSSSIIVTPSTLFGSNLGMDGYFLNPSNQISLKLGQSLASSLVGNLLPNYDLSLQIKPILFPREFTLTDSWVGPLQEYITQEGNVMFSDTLYRLNLRWQDYVQRWLTYEVFARAVLDGSIKMESLVPRFSNPEMFNRIEHMLSAVKSLLKHSNADGYNFAWNNLNLKLQMQMHITPKDMHFLLINHSFCGLLQQVTTLEWIRNVYEGYCVNASEVSSLERNFI